MVIYGKALASAYVKLGPKPVLNDNKWKVIKQVADASQGPNYWAVGDRKSVVLNGSVGYGSLQATFNNTKYWVYIIGFDHNSAKEGKGIAFQGFKTAQTGGVDVCVVTNNYDSSSDIGRGMIMNTSKTTSGGWNGSVAYTQIMPQWKNCFPSDLQAAIKSTTLYTDDVGGGSTDASNVKASGNEVYYLAEYEVFGVQKYANANESAQQQQYAYYKAGNSKVKYRSDSTSTTASWWLRSPNVKYGMNFLTVGLDGSYNWDFANRSHGSAPCFKV